MESRKLIKFGDSSFVVSLPKQWITKYNLNKGDLIYMNFGEDHLIIRPKLKEKKKKFKEIVININDKDIAMINRLITSAYIHGYNRIIVTGNNHKIIKDIREKLHSMVALEVMEQTPDTIIAKDFLNMKEISIQDTIRKMDTIIRTMINDSKHSYKIDNIESIAQRDRDVDRLTFLVFRAISCAIEDPAIASTYKMNAKQLLSYWILATDLEKLADEPKRIAKILATIKIDKKMISAFESLYSEVYDLYVKTMKAYYTDDKKLAYNLASKKKKLIEKCNTFIEKHPKKEMIKVINNIKGLIISTHSIGRILYIHH